MTSLYFGLHEFGIFEVKVPKFAMAFTSTAATVFTERGSVFNPQDSSLKESRTHQVQNTITTSLAILRINNLCATYKTYRL
jgi:hypothetical protein